MSAVPAAQDQLLALLDAAFSASTTQVRFAWPPDRPSKRERVYVIDERAYVRGGGEQYRQETFSARCVVEVYRQGDDPKATSDRRWEIVDAIDAALMADDFVGYATEGGTLRADSVMFGYEKGWIARSILSLDVGARL